MFVSRGGLASSVIQEVNFNLISHRIRLSLPLLDDPSWPPNAPQLYPDPQTYPDPQSYPAPSDDPIEVKISGPTIQTVRPGETVQFDCSARPKFRIQVCKSCGIFKIGLSVF